MYVCKTSVATTRIDRARSIRDLIRQSLTKCLQGKYTVTLIEGDGIGPEISQSIKDIFEAAKVRLYTMRVKKHGRLIQVFYRPPSSGSRSMLLRP